MPETQISIALLFILGALVGVLGGFFGVGGGWIVTPTLHILGMPMPYAVGTGLAYIAGMSFISVVKHRLSGHVETVLGLVLGGGTMLGLLLGKHAVMVMERLGVADPAVRALYMVLLVSLGVFILRDCWREQGRGVRRPERLRDDVRTAWFRRWRGGPFLHLRRSGVRVSFWPIAASGLAVGGLSGVVGTGGGFLLVPIMFYLIGIPIIYAVGTSLLCIVVSSPFGVLAYAMEGRVDFMAAAVMLVGVVVAAPLGVHAARTVRGLHLRGLYGLMILCGGVSVAFKELQVRFGTPVFGWLSQTLIFSAAAGIVAVILLLWFRAARSGYAAGPGADRPLE